MGRRCLLCGKSYRRKSDNNTSSAFALHSFPKNENIRAAWKTFCGLPGDYPEHKLQTHRVCSAHFTRSDYIEPDAKLIGGTTLQLKHGVVPSVLSHIVLSESKMYNVDTKNLAASFDTDSAESQITTSDLSDPIFDNNCYSKNLKLEQECDISPHVLNEKSDESLNVRDGDYQFPVSADQLCYPQKLFVSALDGTDVQIVEVKSENLADRTKDNSEHNYAQVQSNDTYEKTPTTPKRRKFAYPRYISEVETSDFATPDGARRTLKFIKAEDKKKTDRINKMQTKIKYLRKRIATLEDLVASLKHKRLVSEETRDILTVEAFW